MNKNNTAKGIVTTIPERCKRCYTCVRECPARAIKVENGQATVIDERCIACGNCVKVCAQKAKQIEDATPEVYEVLQGDRPVFACLAPSFPAAFNNTTPGKIIAGLRKLGFAQVFEVAFGAELVSRQYIDLFQEHQHTGEPLIATPCPAIVAFVEKYMPSLRDTLAPVVSPMVAVARAIRQRYDNDVHIVFIGPCIAKKYEIRTPDAVREVDSVLTFVELDNMFKAAGIKLDTLPESGFDGPRSFVGKSFAISGGLLKTAGLQTDILENDIVVTEGKARAIAALKELAAGNTSARFFDILFCEGCISGPKMLNDLSLIARKELLANYINEQNRFTTQKDFAESMAEFAELDLTRSFRDDCVLLPPPTEDQIRDALRSMNKFAPTDHLNCGACGYPTCREKAIAMCQGLADRDMCLPYVVEELEGACGQLRASHEELESAQARLVQSERLASVGQLSAGVAHELNNPLGTVLLYSHMLLKQLQGDDEAQEDLKMIVDEANRCKTIVRGLLDFARKSRVSKSPTDLAEVIDDIVTLTAPDAQKNGVTVKTSSAPDLPTMMIDPDQIKQVLINLVQNGIGSMSDGGSLTITAAPEESGEQVRITISDTGCGIPPENLPKLFTPFFTTKEMGLGTGLGLAICYGIVKTHCGQIWADSEVGEGTTFTIVLPREAPNQADEGAQAKLGIETIG